VVRFDGMSKRKALVDLIVGASALASPRNDACLFELTQDPLHCSLRDTHRLSYFSDPDVRVSGDAQKYVPVITQESPCGGALYRRAHRLPDSSYIKHESGIDKQEINIML
jgi:hypothetical protein